MSKAGGFITLHRKILDWEWYGDVSTFRLFVHLLLTVNFKGGRFQGRLIRRGQIVTSLSQLATGSGLSIQQTKTALKHLISTGEVTNESCSQYRIITVVKYDEYQTLTNQLTNDQQTTNKATNKRSTNDLTNDQQQYNNDNNINNGTNITMEQGNGRAPRFTPPTKDEITDFCRENNLAVDVDYLYDHYSSNGWMAGRNHMKDWKAAVRNWARRDKKEYSPKQPAQLPVRDFEQRDYSNEQDEAMDRLLAWRRGDV